MNPRLQECLEEQVFREYDQRGQELLVEIDRVAALDYSALPQDRRQKLSESFDKASQAMPLAEAVRRAKAAISAYEPEYRPIHVKVRGLQSQIRDLDEQIDELEKARSLASRDEQVDEQLIEEIGLEIELIAQQKTDLEDQIPDNWTAARKRYNELVKELNKARRLYRSTVDQAYEAVAEARSVVNAADALAALEPALQGLAAAVREQPAEQAMETIEAAEAAIDEVAGAGDIRTRVSKARRSLKGKAPDPDEALALIDEAKDLFATELSWRRQAAEGLADALSDYDDAIKGTIGIRMQRRLTTKQAEDVASCQSHHKDVSLHF
jgi:chromosome segregation ATPase